MQKVSDMVKRHYDHYDPPHKVNAVNSFHVLKVREDKTKFISSCHSPCFQIGKQLTNLLTVVGLNIPALVEIVLYAEKAIY